MPVKTAIKAKVLLLATAMFAAFSAHAGDVMPPTLTPGASFEFHRVDGFTGAENQHWTLTFQGMKNGNYAYSGVNREGKYTVYRSKNLNNFAVDKRTGEVSEAQILRWPLTVGNSYSYQYQGNTIKVNVTDFEKVETPAGVFDAYRIKLNGTWHDEDNYSGPWYEIYWYAPSVGFFVKIEYSSADMLGRHLQWRKTELIKYTIPSVQASPAN